jgi:hypothetical protein
MASSSWRLPGISRRPPPALATAPRSFAAFLAALYCASRSLPHATQLVASRTGSPATFCRTGLPISCEIGERSLGPRPAPVPLFDAASGGPCEQNRQHALEGAPAPLPTTTMAGTLSPPDPPISRAQRRAERADAAPPARSCSTTRSTGVSVADTAGCAAGGGPPGTERARSAIMERPFSEPQPVCLENGSSASPP